MLQILAIWVSKVAISNRAIRYLKNPGKVGNEPYESTNL